MVVISLLAQWIQPSRSGVPWMVTPSIPIARILALFYLWPGRPLVVLFPWMPTAICMYGPHQSPDLCPQSPVGVGLASTHRRQGKETGGGEEMAPRVGASPAPTGTFDAIVSIVICVQ